MPEWAGWVLFIMLLMMMGSRKDYSGVIGEISIKVEELENRITELEEMVNELDDE